MSLAFLEYEEQFGRFWHRLVGDQTSYPRFPEAAVSLEGERRRLAVLFRGLGGDPALELAAGTARTSTHRLRLRQKLGMSEERLARAERTGELVLLPVLDCLPTPELNRDLFVWLTAFLAAAEPAEATSDPLRRDVAACGRSLSHRPGAGGVSRPQARHARLGAALLALRPARHLRRVEAEVEAAVRRLHGTDEDGARHPRPCRCRATPPRAATAHSCPAPCGARCAATAPAGARSAPRARAATPRPRTRSASSVGRSGRTPKTASPGPADADQQGRVPAARDRDDRRQPARRRRGPDGGAAPPRTWTS